jgi:hypothetical protein
VNEPFTILLCAIHFVRSSKHVVPVMSIFPLKNFDIWPMTSVGGSDTGIKVGTRRIIVEYVENGVWFSTDFLKLHFHPTSI